MELPGRTSAGCARFCFDGTGWPRGTDPGARRAVKKSATILRVTHTIYIMEWCAKNLRANQMKRRPGNRPSSHSHLYIWCYHGPEKQRRAATTDPENAEFFRGVRAGAPRARSIYIWSETGGGCKVHCRKAGRDRQPGHRDQFSYLRRRARFKKLQIFVRSRRFRQKEGVFHLSGMAGTAPGGRQGEFSRFCGCRW